MSEQNHERDYMREPSAREQQEKEAEQRRLEEAKQRADKTEDDK